MSSESVKNQLSLLFGDNPIGASFRALYGDLLDACKSSSQKILAEYLLSQFAEEIAREFCPKGDLDSIDPQAFDLEAPVEVYSEQPIEVLEPVADDKLEGAVVEGELASDEEATSDYEDDLN